MNRQRKVDLFFNKRVFRFYRDMKKIVKSNLGITMQFEKCDYITNTMIKHNIMGWVIASIHSIG